MYASYFIVFGLWVRYIFLQCIQFRIFILMLGFVRISHTHYRYMCYVFFNKGYGWSSPFLQSDTASRPAEISKYTHSLLAGLALLATRCGLTEMALTRLALAHTHTHTQPRGRVGAPPLVLGRHNYSQILCCSFFASAVTLRLGLLAFRWVGCPGCFSSPSGGAGIMQVSVDLGSLSAFFYSSLGHLPGSGNRPLSKNSTSFFNYRVWLYSLKPNL